MSLAGATFGFGASLLPVGRFAGVSWTCRGCVVHLSCPCRGLVRTRHGRVAGVSRACRGCFVHPTEWRWLGGGLTAAAWTEPDDWPTYLISTLKVGCERTVSCCMLSSASGYKATESLFSEVEQQQISGILSQSRVNSGVLTSRKRATHRLDGDGAGADDQVGPRRGRVLALDWLQQLERVAEAYGRDFLSTIVIGC